MQAGERAAREVQMLRGHWKMKDLVVGGERRTECRQLQVS